VGRFEALHLVVESMDQDLLRISSSAFMVSSDAQLAIYRSVQDLLAIINAEEEF